MEGDNDSLDLTARFRDGTVLCVRDSSKVSYRSTDENVASVDAHGFVTAIGEGEAGIIATYGPQPGGPRVRSAK
jgi:Bacterial Ig-like domain (group 2)